MSDQVITHDIPVSERRWTGSLPIKPISWAAIFAGVLVALGVGMLFLTFGLFIGFRLSPANASMWTSIWYWICCFFSLLAGGYVAGRLSGNREAGRTHGLVTWGVTTAATSAFLAFLTWGLLSQAAGFAKTAALATATAAPSAERMSRSQADRLQEQLNTAMGQAQMQAPQVAKEVAHNISNASLMLWIGFIISVLGATAGGAMGARRIRTPAEAL
jgi:hypothetical protein